MILVMQLLAKRIEDRLTSHKFCRVFENQLEWVWPIAGKDQLRQRRIEKIKAFCGHAGLGSGSQRSRNVARIPREGLV